MARIITKKKVEFANLHLSLLAVLLALPLGARHPVRLPRVVCRVQLDLEQWENNQLIY